MIVNNRAYFLGETSEKEKPRAPDDQYAQTVLIQDGGGDGGETGGGSAIPGRFRGGGGFYAGGGGGGGILPDDGAVVEIVGERIEPDIPDEAGPWDQPAEAIPDVWPEQTGGILPDDGAVVEITATRLPTLILEPGEDFLIPRDTSAPVFLTVSPDTQIVPFDYVQIPDFVQDPEFIAMPVYLAPEELPVIPDFVEPVQDFLYPITPRPAPTPERVTAPGGQSVPVPVPAPVLTPAPPPASSPAAPGSLVRDSPRMLPLPELLPYGGSGTNTPAQGVEPRPGGWLAWALLIGSLLIER